MDVCSFDPDEQAVGSAGAVPGLQPAPTQVDEVIGPLLSELVLDVVNFLSDKNALICVFVRVPVQD